MRRANPIPFVERLLEGVAFLGARVGLKLQDQVSDFTLHLLNAVQPHYVAPTPSMCVVEFQPAEGDPGLARGVRVPRLTQLPADAGPDAAQVTFRTAHDVDLLPLRIAEAEYLPSRASVAAYAGGAAARAEAGLRLRLTTIAGASLAGVAASRLPIYLAGSDIQTGALYRQLGDAMTVVAGPPGGGA
ncbi:type VI secretion system baseplate subunit TssF [Sphingomonas sp. MMS24-JH45]